MANRELSLPYVPVDPDIESSPKMHAFLRAAGLRNDPMAPFYIVKMLLWFGRHAPTGVIDKHHAEALADICAWPLEPEDFVPILLKTRWLEEVGDTYAVVNWDSYGGRHIRNRVARRERYSRGRVDDSRRQSTTNTPPPDPETPTAESVSSTVVDCRRLSLYKEIKNKELKEEDLSLKKERESNSELRTEYLHLRLVEPAGIDESARQQDPQPQEAMDPHSKLNHMGELRAALIRRPHLPAGGLKAESEARARRLFPIRECELDRAAENLLKQGKLPQPAIILCHIESQLRDPKDLSRPHPTRGIAQPVDWDAEVREQEARDALRAARGAAR